MKITAPHLLLCLTASLDRISTPQNWSYPKYCFCLHLYCIHFSKHTQTIFLPLRLCRHQSFSWLLEHMISDRWPHTWRPIFWPNAETALKEKRKQKQETLGPPSADPLTMQGPVLSAPTHTELQRHAYTPGSRGVCVWTVAARTGLVPQLVSLLLWWNSLMLTEVSFENKHTTLHSIDRVHMLAIILRPFGRIRSICDWVNRSKMTQASVPCVCFCVWGYIG